MIDKPPPLTEKVPDCNWGVNVKPPQYSRPHGQPSSSQTSIVTSWPEICKGLVKFIFRGNDCVIAFDALTDWIIPFELEMS